MFDALPTLRFSKEAFNDEKVAEILREGRGRHFDPRILDLFYERLEEVIEIQGQSLAEAGVRKSNPLLLTPKTSQLAVLS